MPIIVDPSFVRAPVVGPVVGPDGVVSARVDAANAGVLLSASFPAGVFKVRFVRGDGTAVRSGDPAWAPGGVAVAYDHEAPLGVGVSWSAVPIYTDGSEGAPSAAVATMVPEPVGVRGSWLKSTTDAALSMQVWIESPPVLSRGGRVTAGTIYGSSFPSATWDVRSAIESTFSIITETIAEGDALLTLLDSGPLLYQTQTRFGIQDLYLLPGDVSQEWAAGRVEEPLCRWTFPVTEVARPATIDAPLRIPGQSYDQVGEDYLSYQQLGAQVPSYLALVGVA